MTFECMLHLWLVLACDCGFGAGYAASAPAKPAKPAKPAAIRSSTGASLYLCELTRATPASEASR